MKVFLVFGTDNYGDTVLGVYKSFDVANKRADFLKKTDKRWFEYSVSEYEVIEDGKCD